MCAAACPKGSVVPPQVLAARARLMRFASNAAESLLWEQIRGRRLGVLFKRQVPIGGRYVVDFLAPELGVVVEVDGAYHSRRRAADARRDERLRRAGYRVLRLKAEVVERQLALAIELVRAELAAARNSAR
jgi:very-short-patch-repair endonuclease